MALSYRELRTLSLSYIDEGPTSTNSKHITWPLPIVAVWRHLTCANWRARRKHVTWRPPTVVVWRHRSCVSCRTRKTQLALLLHARIAGCLSSRCLAMRWHVTISIAILKQLYSAHIENFCLSLFRVDISSILKYLNPAAFLNVPSEVFVRISYLY
jgi:hypothetical protein